MTPGKILLADDEWDLLSLMKETLESGGYEVTGVTDGREAFEEVKKAPYDLVIADLQMPLKTGFELCQEIKKDPSLHHIPVIILTASNQVKTKVQGLNLGADDYLTKPVDIEELMARVGTVLRRSRQNLDANPLTRLPGNAAIESRIEQAIRSGAPFAVLYVDLNNFKAYNDAYGFEAGDKVLLATAGILLSVLRRDGSAEDFLGHIGGDDFILLTLPENAAVLCEKIISSFDSSSPSFYNEEDRRLGYILSVDRKGASQKFPLLSIAIGVVTNQKRKISSLGQVSQIGSELKKYAKQFAGSRYVADRRESDH